ncbi:hypothetical protein ACKVWC_006371 [Pyricularia oryzae]
MGTTFPHFSDLPAELRSKIWVYALESHADHVIANAPPQIRNPINKYGNPVPFDDGASALVVDCFAIPASCRQARDLHLSRLKKLGCSARRCFKYVSEWWYDPLGAGPMSILLWGEGGDDDGCSEVTISGGRFRSAEHLVAIVTMLFGNTPERITMDFEIRGPTGEMVCASGWVYWPKASFWDFDRDVNPSGSDSESNTLEKLRDVYESVFETIEKKFPIAEGPTNYFPENDGMVLELIPPGTHHLIALYPNLSTRFSWAVTGIDHLLVVHLFRMRDLFLAAGDALPRLSRLDVSFEFCDWSSPDDHLAETWDGPDWLILGCVRKGDLYCCWMHEWPNWTFLWR